MLCECGHLNQGWPLLADLGGRNQRVFCDECTKAKYGLTPDQQVIVFVSKQQPSEWQSEEAPKAKPKKQKPPAPPPQSETLF